MVSILVLGFAAAEASASQNDGAAPTAIQDFSLNITTATHVEMENPSQGSRLPPWTSVLPPLLAIALALIFRNVLVALVLGVWLGAYLSSGLSLVASFARLLDTYVVDALADRGHASIVVFSLLLGGMLGLMTRSGGG